MHDSKKESFREALERTAKQRGYQKDTVQWRKFVEGSIRVVERANRNARRKK